MRFVVLIVAPVFAFLVMGQVYGRDNGQYANPELKAWFDGLENKKHNRCCSDADGTGIGLPDWGTEQGPDGKSRYWVTIQKQHIAVPDDAVITEPNKYGQAVAWPVWKDDRVGTWVPLKDYLAKPANFAGRAGHIEVLCFMPGAEM
jgi:hypothetical protein